MKKIIATIGAAAALTFAGIGAAQATDTEPAPEFAVALWEVADPTNVWAEPQVLVGTNYTATPDPTFPLSQFGDVVECGTFYQIDVYRDSDITQALLSGGVLYGPGNPTEDFPAYETQDNPEVPGWPWGTSFHTTVWSEDCVTPESPEPSIPPSTEPPVVMPEPSTPPVVEPQPTCPPDLILVEDGSCVPPEFFEPEQPAEVIPPVYSEQPVAPVPTATPTYSAPAPTPVAEPVTSQPATLPETGTYQVPMWVAPAAVLAFIAGILILFFRKR